MHFNYHCSSLSITEKTTVVDLLPMKGFLGREIQKDSHSTDLLTGHKALSLTKANLTMRNKATVRERKQKVDKTRVGLHNIPTGSCYQDVGLCNAISSDCIKKTIKNTKIKITMFCGVFIRLHNTYISLS